jgi:hypothetical protein
MKATERRYEGHAGVPLCGDRYVGGSARRRMTSLMDCGPEYGLAKIAATGAGIQAFPTQPPSYYLDRLP